MTRVGGGCIGSKLSNTEQLLTCPIPSSAQCFWSFLLIANQSIQLWTGAALIRYRSANECYRSGLSGQKFCVWRPRDTGMCQVPIGRRIATRGKELMLTPFAVAQSIHKRLHPPVRSVGVQIMPESANRGELTGSLHIRRWTTTWPLDIDRLFPSVSLFWFSFVFISNPVGVY